MKRIFKISIILLTLICWNTQPINSKTSKKVYYVVVGSFSNIDNAINEARTWNGKQPSIYKTNSKGRVLYRLCPISFTSKSQAKTYIDNNGLNGWVWASNGNASRVWSPSTSSSFANSDSRSQTNSTRWLLGTWIYHINGGAYLKVKIINDTQLIEYIYMPTRGEMDFPRTYYISGDRMNVSSGGNYYIDWKGRRLLTAERNSFTKL